MVEERVARSATWRIIHWLGSLQLALILLATIAIACAAATVAESEFSTKVAQAYIYKAPWFVVWLGVLCVNLFAVTVTRWPWEKRHAGFIVTHYGIILLLVGAMVGLRTGFEGNVTLHKEKAPVRKVTVNRSIIQVESPNDTALYVMPFDASTARLSEKRPHEFAVPGSDLTIVADGFNDNLVEVEELVESTDGGPGVVVRLTSPRMGEEVEMAMVEGGEAERDFFGLAKVAWAGELPSAGGGGMGTRMVFGKFAPVVAGGGGDGVEVMLSADGSKVTIVYDKAASATYRREEVMGRPIEVGGAVVVVEDYWPDFEMRDGRPASVSTEPNNPAMLVRVRSVEAAGEGGPQLVMAPRGDGVAYQLRRGGAVLAEGEVGAGGGFATGWADWRAEVVEFLPRAAVTKRVVPGPPLAKGENGVPGFRARLVSPEVGDADGRWVPSGEVTALTDGRHVVRVGYGLELRPVPFSLRLVDFEVPRYEGTETPSDFIATVEFRDQETGEVKRGTAKMNHPASFPGTMFANLTGINYKFSQAEWNPRDLGETTLQVLYDPGWLFKWTGSLAICMGITMMFYMKPRTKKS
jgi:hypothetical protein